MKMTEEEVERWDAEDDHGNRYTVIEWQTFKLFEPLSGPPTWVPTVKRLALTTGEHVNVKDDETYEIFDSEIIIRRI
jgi:hypothetical protein